MSDEGKEISVGKKELAGLSLVDRGLAEMRKKYGTGVGDGETPLASHNGIHTADVLRAVELISDLAIKKGKMSPVERVLAKIAAVYHDIEQRQGSGTNEEASAQEAVEAMVAAEVFSDEEIGKVRSMILATRVFFDQEGVMKQMITEDYLSKVMADADLWTLGAPSEVFWDRTVRLLKEFKRAKTLSGDDIQEFAAEQALFIQSHPFHTEEARLLFPNAGNNIKFCLEKSKVVLAI